jgi:hypothetical protein
MILNSFLNLGPTNTRQKMVRDSFIYAWDAYKKYAWGKICNFIFHYQEFFLQELLINKGQDELLPISKRSSTWFNLGLTIIDSLDTIYIMNLKEQFEEARNWVLIFSCDC